MARLFYDYLTDGIVSIDETGKIYYVNQKGLKMLGRDFEDLGGLDFDMTVLMQNYNGQVVTLDGLGAEQSSLWVVRADRTLFSALVMRFDHENGRKDVLIIDVTEEGNVEGQKDDFISIISHQLRTPANIISWYAEMLLNEKNGAVNDKQRALISQIQGGSRRLSSLMASIVNTARYDLKRIKLKEQHIDIEDFMRRVCTQKVADFEEQNISLTYEIDDNLETSMVTDREYLGIVLKAVVDNSIRYNNPNGAVTIGIKSKPYEQIGEESTEGFQITVEDTGIGIPARQRFDVFNKLFRADNAQRSGETGLGLGLYLAKRYLGQLGGTIHFESSPGDGTIFFINLPKVINPDIIRSNKEKHHGRQ